MKLIKWDKSNITTADIEHRRCPKEQRWRLKKSLEQFGGGEKSRWHAQVLLCGNLPRCFEKKLSHACRSTWRWQRPSDQHACKRHRRSRTSHCSGTGLFARACRAGLTIGQTGQMPGASRFGGLALECQNIPFTGFSCFWAVHLAPKL